jgi:hypothetical protein
VTIETGRLIPNRRNRFLTVSRFVVGLRPTRADGEANHCSRANERQATPLSGEKLDLAAKNLAGQNCP